MRLPNNVGFTCRTILQGHTTLLADYLTRYSQTHELRPSTLEHYHWVVRSFERHNGQLRTSMLSAAAVNAWLVWLAEQHRSPWTIKQRKISLLVLWRAAWQDGLAPALEPVRKLRCLQHSPQAWTLDEVRRLIATATAAGSWWGSLVRAGYDTGLRLGDLLTIEVGQLASNLALCQAKTRRPVLCGLRPTTLWAIRLHLDGRREGLVWPWPFVDRRKTLLRRVRHLISLAGLPQLRTPLHAFRRSVASYVTAATTLSQACDALDHCRSEITRRYYVDPRIAPPEHSIGGIMPEPLLPPL